MKTIYQLQALGDYPDDGEENHFFTTIEQLKIFAWYYYGSNMEKKEGISCLIGEAVPNSRGYNHFHHDLYVNTIKVYDDDDDIVRLAIMADK